MSNDKIIEAQRKGLAATTKKALDLAADQERLVKIIQDIMNEPAVKNELGMYLQGQFEAIIDSNGLDIYELLENGNVVLFKSEEDLYEEAKDLTLLEKLQYLDQVYLQTAEENGDSYSPVELSNESIEAYYEENKGWWDGKLRKIEKK